KGLIPVIDMTNISLLLTLLILRTAVESIANPKEKEQGHIQTLATANNEFAFNLLRKLDSSKNVFFSPFSVSSVFGMLFYGARGGTAEVGLV
ncbi:hypothetical protein NPIL_283271, partial [Nephila pilipes]